MLKKRLIFVLLYSHGNFILSRNFRLQNVGDLRWIQKNYRFSENIGSNIDELVIIDVSREDRDEIEFCKNARAVARECFVPLTIGGGIKSIDRAERYFDCGADKILVNSILHQDRDLVCDLATLYGQQSIIASVDLRRLDDSYVSLICNGTQAISGEPRTVLSDVCNLPIGELYLNSVDKDGTGSGYDFSTLALLPDDLMLPVILAGGAGNHRHFLEGLSRNDVDAVATAHLFNFVGDGLTVTRRTLLAENAALANIGIIASPDV